MWRLTIYVRFIQWCIYGLFSIPKRFFIHCYTWLEEWVTIASVNTVSGFALAVVSWFSSFVSIMFVQIIQNPAIPPQDFMKTNVVMASTITGVLWGYVLIRSAFVRFKREYEAPFNRLKE